ncbi:MAG: hypothetical protein M0Z36_10965, partial [Thermaerobacter sp.]|nr:hypothetical protein [Thermaerobacter sp.]
MTEDTPNVNSQATQDQEIAKILSMPAPALAVPAATKDQWVDALSTQIPHMVYMTEKGASLSPVAAGQTVQDVIPLEWLGDYLLAYIPALGHWTPSRKLLTQTLMAVVPNIKPSYGLRQAEQIIEHAGALSPSYVLGDQPNIAELIARTWDAAPVITFKNGTLHVLSAQLRKHDPQYRTTWSVPFDWDPQAQSHQLDHFLESAVPDPVSRKNLLAFLGYALARY